MQHTLHPEDNFRILSIANLGLRIEAQLNVEGTLKVGAFNLYRWADGSVAARSELVAAAKGDHVFNVYGDCSYLTASFERGGRVVEGAFTFDGWVEKPVATETPGKHPDTPVATEKPVKPVKPVKPRA